MLARERLMSKDRDPSNSDPGDLCVLGIETATDVCSVGLITPGGKESEAVAKRPRAHSECLHSLIAEVLEHADLQANALDLIAVSNGPGSYTGLRIGVSTAKGLAYSTDSGLIGVGTTAGFASQVIADEKEQVCVALPSRNGEVYLGLHPVGKSDVAALSLSDVSQWLQDRDASGVALVGPAAGLVASALESSSIAFREAASRASGLAIANLGMTAWLSGRSDDLAALEPEYLKGFVAKKAKPLFFGS